MYYNVSVSICMYLYLFWRYLNVFLGICMYYHVFLGICMYYHVFLSICMYL